MGDIQKKTGVCPHRLADGIRAALFAIRERTEEICALIDHADCHGFDGLVEAINKSVSDARRAALEEAAAACENNAHPKKTEYADGWDDAGDDCARIIRALMPEEDSDGYEAKGPPLDEYPDHRGG